MGITAINGINITASAFNVTDTTTGVGPYYLVFADGTSGGKTPRVDSSTLTYNATTNALTATSFVGTSSQANTSSLAITASTVISRVVPFSSTCFPTFVDSNNATPSHEALYTSPNYSINTVNGELQSNLINNNTSFQLTQNADITIDCSRTQSFSWVSSFTANRTVSLQNLTIGRKVEMYIENTNATARTIAFSGSTTTTGLQGIHMSVGAGADYANVKTINANFGAMFVTIRQFGNSSTSIFGGIM